MKLGTLIFGVLARPKLFVRKVALSTVLLISVASGCSSVISNSEDFYRNRPPRRINWREYLTD